jgi:pyruvate kinase
MIDAGMDVVRLNTSHGVIEQHQRTVALVRECAETRDRPIGVLMDLGGPKLRTGPTEGGRPLNLVPGQVIRLTPGLVDGTEELLTVDYPSLLEDVQPGDPVLLDDGHIELQVDSTTDDAVVCSIVHGGVLAPNKGVAFPKSNLTMPALTPRDLEAIRAGVECGVDLFAMSFVRTPEDVDKARIAVHRAGADIPIVAKIERRQAIENLDDIIGESDGVMVARGDLGIDLPPEEVPIQQRRIVASAARNKVPVITATQMLESMVNAPRPTRAEASDVANAVWELADAVMLSAETAIGRFPVQTVEMMDRIIRRAEANMPEGSAVAAPHSPDDHSYVIALAARTIVDADPNLRAIVSFTRSGYSAHLMSKAYPGVPIYGVSPDPSVVRRLALARSVIPVYGDHIVDVDELLAAVDELLIEKGYVSPGHEVLVTGSLPMGIEGTTNFLKLHRVREMMDDGHDEA